MFLQVPNGSETRYFLLPNDSYGDLENIESISFGAIGDVAGSDAYITASNNNNVTICFAPETRIETERGYLVPVADRGPGDRVMTADNGLQDIRWVGAKRLSAQRLARNPKLRPIRIRAGSPGYNQPETDLIVSPQHRIVVRSAIAARMFGAQEVLIGAKHLTGINGIDIAQDVPRVVYHHILFDRHEVVLANGAETESLYTGPMAMHAMHRAAHAEIIGLFPELARANHACHPARPLLKGRDGRHLAARHHKHGKPLQTAVA